MLVITYGITVGGLLLPIGSPPNLIGRELLEAETGEPITFFEWFVMALPIVIVMFVAVIVIVTTLQPARGEAGGRRGGVRGRGAEQARAALARREEHDVRARASRWWAGSCPGWSGVVAGDDSDAYTQVSEAANEGIVAILAASLLFVLPVDWARRQASR